MFQLFKKNRNGKESVSSSKDIEADASFKTENNKVKDLDTSIIIIQKSTRTTAKSLSPLHNKLRAKYKWYYNWHMNPIANKVHVGAAVAMTFFALFTLISVLGLHTPTARATGTTKYAINAGGNWSVNGTWSTIAAKDASRVANTTAPATGDDVVLDDYSGSVAVDVATNAMNSFDMTGYTNTLSGTSSIAISPTSATPVDVKIAGTITLTGQLILKSPSGDTINLTTNGKTLPTISVNATPSFTGTVVLLDAVTITNTFSQSYGTLHMDGVADNLGLTHSINKLSLTGNTARTIYLGNSTIGLTRINGPALDISDTTNLTFNAGTSTLNFATTETTAGTVLLQAATTAGGGITFNNVNFTGAGVPAINAPGCTFTTLTRTGTAVLTDGIQFTSGTTTTITTLNLTGNSPANRLLVSSSTLGTAATLTVTTWNTVTNVDFMDITSTNSVNLSAASGGSGDCQGNSGNITFTTPATQTWQTNASESWSNSANWTSRVPLPQDDVVMNKGSAYASGVVITADMPRLGKSIDWTGVTWSGTATKWNINSMNTGNYGSVTLVSGMGMTNSLVSSYYLMGRSSYSLTTAGVTFAKLSINAPSGTYTLGDAYTAYYGVYIIAGGFNTAGFNVTMLYNFYSTGTLTRSVNITNSTITMNNGGGGGWQMVDTGLTLTTTGSTIALSFASGTPSFIGGTQTYNNITIAPGTGSVTFSGAFTFANMTMSSAGAKTVKFTKNTTYTMTGTQFLQGTNGNLVTIASDTGGTAATLAKSGGGIIQTDYLDITDVNASPATTWYYGNNSNWHSGTGWVAGTPVPNAPTNAAIANIGSTTFDTTWTDNSSDETGFKVYVSTVPNADCSVATYGGSPDYTTAADAVSQSVSGKSINSQYCAKVLATNANGDSTASYSTPKYTLTNQPNAPGVNATSTTSLTVIIDVNNNPVATTFAIYNATAGQYVQANGTLGASAVWQNRATWGGDSGVANTGLSVNTSNNYQTKARNGDNTETTLSSGTAKYTWANAPNSATIDSRTSTGINWSWNANSNPGGTNFYASDSAGNSGWAASTTWAQGSLNPNTNYAVTVKARNGDTTETTTTGTSGYTLANIPSAPTVAGNYSVGNGYYTDVTINVNNNPGGTNFWIQYSTDNVTYSDPAGMAWQTGTSYTLTNLSANQQYWFKVKAKNAEGTETGYSSAGSDVTPPAAPISLNSANICPTTASTSWAASTGADNYSLSYGTDVDATNIGTIGNIAVTHQDLSSLINSTPYYFKVSPTSTANGTGAYSSIATFTTGSCSAPTAPINFAGGAVSSSQINWSWTDTASDETAWRVKDSGYIEISPSLVANTTGWNETTLSTNTAYSRLVAVTNGSGSNDSNLATVYTLANTPLAPTLSAPATASVNIIINPNGNPASTHYAIYNLTLSQFVKHADGTLQNDADWQLYADWGGTSGFVNNSLVPATTYTYEIKARNGNNLETGYSTLAGQKTLDAVVAEPSETSAQTSATSPTLTPTTGQSTDVVPVANISIPTDISNVEINNTVSFDASKSTGNIASYGWDFDDGTTATGAKIDHKFELPGRFVVKLTITDKTGAKSITTSVVDIKPPAPTILSVKASGNDIIVSGEAFPETTVFITVHSDTATFKTIADKNGKFSYTIKNGGDLLAEGGHTISASSSVVLADTTQISGKSSKTYDFQLSVDNGKLVIETRAMRIWRDISITMAIIIVVGLAVLLIRKRKRQMRLLNSS